MKAKTVRLLAGGLAAVTLMSNMAVMPVFADEAHTVDAVATEAVADDSYDAEAAETVQESENDEPQVSTETEEETESQDAEETQSEADEQETEETAGETEADEADDDDTEEAQDETAKADAADAETSKDESGKQTVENQTDEDAAKETNDETASTDAAEKSVEAESAQDTKSEKDADLISAEDADEPVLGAAAPAEGKDEDGENTKRMLATLFEGFVRNGGELAGYDEHMIKEAKKEADRIEKEITSVEDVMSLIMNMDTTKTLPTICKDSLDAKANKTENAKEYKYHEAAEKTYQTVRNAYSKAIEKALGCVPYVKNVAGPLKDLVLKMIGLGAERLTPQKSVADHINDLSKQLDDVKHELKRTIETVPTIKEYGVRLDAFTSSATTMAQKIEDYKNDNTLSDNEKAVKIAALLGHSSTWDAGNSNILNQMHYAAQSMRSKNKKGPKADLHARNLFEAIYDYNKETSMFSGETMDKANPAIQVRIAEYAENCKVLAEVLRAHDKVAGFTSEEAAALSDSVKDTYNRIKSDKKNVRTQMNDIIATFTGNKTSTNESARYGILDAAKDYYSKDRLIFIEKDGDKFNEIKLSPKVATIKSEDYFNLGVGREDYDKKSGLEYEQIRKLQSHANKLGIPMCEYLERVGFDMSEIKATNRKAILSTLRYNSYGSFSSRGGSGHQDDYYYGCNMKEKGAGEVSHHVYHCTVPYFKLFFKTKKYTLNDGLIVQLRTPETKANAVTSK